MSFGINGPDNNQPLIQKSQNMQNNGGGGNLGYFQQGKKKKKEEKEELDVFQLSSKEPAAEEELKKEQKRLNEIGIKIKNFWMQMNSNLDKNNPFNDKKETT